MRAVCDGDKSNDEPCPVHGYNPALPAPEGFAWRSEPLPDGGLYTFRVSVPVRSVPEGVAGGDGPSVAMTDDMAPARAAALAAAAESGT